jgi:CDP-4-dehydro-6-deoxyglucose reductase
MSFYVRLARSGRSFDASANEAVLDAAMRQGILIPYGCRNGACGSCRARLTDGSVNYPAGDPASLDERQRQRGEVLLCQAHATSDIELDVDELDVGSTTAVRTLPVRVMKLERLADDVMLIGLKLPATERLQYLPGQYLEILLRDGRRRAFSIANPPHAGEFLELHVRRVPDGMFSGQVFDSMKERALLRVHGPLGSFFLRDSGRAAVIVAGGTGFAPAQALIEGAIAAGDSRPVHLYWGVRDLPDLYRHERAGAWAAAHGHIRYVPVLSEPSIAANWQGRTGFVHTAVLEDAAAGKLDLAQADIYASGPPIMVDSIRGTFPDAGMNTDHLYYDAFDYAFETGHDTV